MKPSAQLALVWYHAGGRGSKNMVVIPYKDRLELFSRHLQQPTMESLGKESDQFFTSSAIAAGISHAVEVEIVFRPANGYRLTHKPGSIWCRPLV